MAPAKLWDAETAKPLGEPLRHTNDMEKSTFSPDGKLVLTGGMDDAARLWNAATRQPLGPPLPHDRGVGAVAFSPDGGTILLGGLDGTLRFVAGAAVEGAGPAAAPRRRRGVGGLPRTGRPPPWHRSPHSACVWGCDERSPPRHDVQPYPRSQCRLSTRMARRLPPAAGIRTCCCGMYPLRPSPRRQPHAQPFALQGGARLAVFTPGWPATADRRRKGGAGGGCLGRGDAPGARLVFSARDRGGGFGGEPRWASARRGLRRPHRAVVWDVEKSPGRGGAAPAPGTGEGVAFSPDGKATDNGLSGRSGAAVGRRHGPAERAVAASSGPVLAVAFSPDGRSLATGGGDGQRASGMWRPEWPLGPPQWHADAVAGGGVQPGRDATPDGGRDRTAAARPLAGAAGAARRQREQVRLWVEALTGLEWTSRARAAAARKRDGGPSPASGRAGGPPASSRGGSRLARATSVKLMAERKPVIMEETRVNPVPTVIGLLCVSRSSSRNTRRISA